MHKLSKTFYNPLINNSIGLDDFFNTLNNVPNNAGSFPPYDIIKLSEDHCVLKFAIAGFKEDEINIQYSENTLTVSGKAIDTETETVTYMWKGIAKREFSRKFNLAPYFEVKDAKLADGILTISLVRNVPDALKPKIIKISKQE